MSRISTHSPRVGRTLAFSALDKLHFYFNSLAPCGANLAILHNVFSNLSISTHSPRVGRTETAKSTDFKFAHFNSLAPCGANLVLNYGGDEDIEFQLTRPVWGEPLEQQRAQKLRENFNSLAPCGANPRREGSILRKLYISTHSPRVGRTTLWSAFENGHPISTHSPRVGRTDSNDNWRPDKKAFQLTRPVWGEPRMLPMNGAKWRISTHSPRVGRTHTAQPSGIVRGHFNSLAPCGANPHFGVVSSFMPIFQLTRPVWGEPAAARLVVFCLVISTHSPRVGRTRLKEYFSKKTDNFNSLAPCGANPLIPLRLACTIKFQLTRPVWGEPKVCVLPANTPAFQLTRPVWGEPISRGSVLARDIISTHSPRVGRTLLRLFVVLLDRHFNSLAPCGANLENTSI